MQFSLDYWSRVMIQYVGMLERKRRRYFLHYKLVVAIKNNKMTWIFRMPILDCGANIWVGFGFDFVFVFCYKKISDIRYMFMICL